MLRRFLHHRVAVVALVVLGLIFVFAFVGQRVWPYKAAALYGEVGQTRGGTAHGGPTLSEPKRCHGDYSEIIAQRFRSGPCAPHLFGSDGNGHDMVAETMRGSQISLSIAVLVAVLATSIGTTLGAIAGFYRGWVDGALMRGTDFFLTIPLIAVAGTLSVHVRGGSWWILAVILGALGWMPIARVIRAEFISLREKEFVEAERCLGASDRRVMARTVLPNCLSPLVVQFSLGVGYAMLVEAGLSFLGLGVQPPTPAWGQMVGLARNFITIAPWLITFPGIAIFLAVLAFNFLGDGLREATDPRLRGRRLAARKGGT